MSEACPDFFPEDWVDAKIVHKKYFDVKKYADGVEVEIWPADMIGADESDPQDYETIYPNGDSHFEHGRDEETGRLTGHSIFIPYEVAEDAEI